MLKTKNNSQTHHTSPYCSYWSHPSVRTTWQPSATQNRFPSDTCQMKGYRIFPRMPSKCFLYILILFSSPIYFEKTGATKPHNNSGGRHTGLLHLPDTWKTPYRQLVVIIIIIFYVGVHGHLASAGCNSFPLCDS